LGNWRGWLFVVGGRSFAGGLALDAGPARRRNSLREARGIIFDIAVRRFEPIYERLFCGSPFASDSAACETIKGPAAQFSVT